MSLVAAAEAVARQRRLGAYYTPTSASRFMAGWVLRSDGDHILEPSLGDGVFVRALHEVAIERGLREPRITGVEIDPETRAKTISSGIISPSDTIEADFLQLPTFKVDAVIGNPPFVRVRHLGTEAERAAAISSTIAAIPGGMSTSGSTWLPFVIRSAESLRLNGRLAMVLPTELTYVKYARPLWNFLAAHFTNIRVLRSFERLFPDILQDVVILLAEGHGGNTQHVQHEIYEDAARLDRGEASLRASISVSSLATGSRAFTDALLPSGLTDILDGLEGLRSAQEVVKFNIGYVAGHKRFFHPSPETVAEHDLPPDSLVPALTSTRGIRGGGLHTSSLNSLSTLFRPRSTRGARLTYGEQEYIRAGIDAGVDTGYKCRIREPWYEVPGVKTPDLVLSVFSSTPVLLVNDAKIVASNSLLCGFLQGKKDPRSVAGSWYTSLTLLEIERNVHSLGGGVLVLIPGETDRLRLVKDPSTEHLPEVSTCLEAGHLEDAYRAGDVPVLRRGLGLSDGDLEAVSAGIEVLQRWRTGR